MRIIDSIDFFYLSMPEVLDIGDGSQDALLVRIAAGDQAAWGECEASPLTTIASLVCPMSHSACKPVSASVLGKRIETIEDINRIHQAVRENSMDLLQADHALSGIDVALWNLLGLIRQEPVYRLLGYPQAYPKIPYFSLLFGDTPQDTLEKAQKAWAEGYHAVKFGWGSFGRGDVRSDADQLVAAREGLGKDGILCIDAGTVWGSDIEEAQKRLGIMQDCQVAWLEEPFHTGALHAYKQLAALNSQVKLAGGEGAHNEYMAQHMIDYAGISYIQVDTGRIGGITSAQRVAQYAVQTGVIFINHTFTSHLALSASLQAYAGLADHILCEYPGQLSPLAYEVTEDHITPNQNGEICIPDRPGLGITPDLTTMRKYLVEIEIIVNGKTYYQVPTL
jgi:L-alanine-DL-glutamate epimerase-like enolase superfamily enzyme